MADPEFDFDVDPVCEETPTVMETQFPPAPSPDPDFCPPGNCPQTCPQPRFSSPRTELPPEEAEQLERCIITANTLLLTLGISPLDDEDGLEGGEGAEAEAGEEAGGEGNNRSLQVSFRRMRGTQIKLQLKEGNKLIGTVHDAGRNYLQLDRIGEIILIPFTRILTITRSAHQFREEPQGRALELLDIDARFRRNLVLDFGNVVACSPELSNLFFGITLSQKLTSLIGCEVVVHLENEQEWRGTVLGTDEGSLQLCIKKDLVRNIELDQIVTLRII